MSYAGDMTPQEAWAALEQHPEAVLVDCRTAAEWAFVGVPDVSALGKQAVLIEWVSFPSMAPNPRFVEALREAGVDDDAEVLFLCRSGHRSIGAAEAATAAGIEKAYNILDGFEGGLDAQGHRGAAGWRAEGLPWRQQ
ncbi:MULTISPECIES: rhodanese-like domain-containing protein [unclassified Gordonia (in: high G+C Gram-positive bacteria)]|uniref:rhodanese-like domain-containing protein n=1 Tax=unclassified Gordonia (in: high G+C Gram-positive bacteria) TaxID=2657482 RepID=UPI001FFF62D3|nr:MULTISPECIES: rhodanese-like domain-containing protein [unclassified Gordonia (in: high G+C Gram-positive bacteria)]UQE75509.1 rhodanese-like domain-containing protein [Gordonia sp. PP30]